MDYSSDRLDSEELLHLAMQSAQAGWHDRAIVLLKQAWSANPRDARIIYCLGAEHAEIGMYERAMAEMAKALELEPSLDVARIQLALMCAGGGRVEQAESTLAPLLDRPEDDSALHFARGLTAMLRDDIANAIPAVERGIALNAVNPALNGDMARLLESMQAHVAAMGPAGAAKPAVRAAPVSTPAADAQADPQASSEAGSNLWVSSYRKAGGGAS